MYIWHMQYIMMYIIVIHNDVYNSNIYIYDMHDNILIEIYIYIIHIISKYNICNI